MHLSSKENVSAQRQTTGQAAGIGFIADLTVRCGENVVAVQADERSVRLNLSSIRSGLSLWRQVRRSEPLRNLQRLARRADRPILVGVDGITIAGYTPMATGGVAEKLLGIWPLKLRWGKIIAAFLSQPSRREGPRADALR